MDKKSIIEKAYRNFNSRNADEVLSLMTQNVNWPNGWEGGYVVGHENVKEYWTRQWKEIDPTVTPTQFTELENGDLKVEVHQVVKDNGGDLLFDGMLFHTYSFADDLISGMEIAQSAGNI